MKVEDIDRIKKAVDSFKIPKKHKEYVFLASKGWEGKNERFIMYLYGGHFVDLSITARGKLSCQKFMDDKYCKHFSTTKRGKEIRQEFSDRNRYQNKDGIEVLKNWDSSVWEEICQAYHAWAIKTVNSEYERKRQTRISQNTEMGNDILIFDMEENVLLPSGKNGELDMAAMRFKGNIPILSFIEYKCTESALTGKIDFKKHYEDMVQYYQIDKYKQEFIKMYNHKILLMGKSMRTIDYRMCKTEIVFLITHMKEQIEKENEYVSRETVLKKLKLLEKCKDFAKNKKNIKILIMEDETVNYDPKNYMSYDETIKKLSKKD